MLLALIGFIFLIFSQRIFTILFSKIISLLGGGQRTIVWLWSLFFLPGTLMHEIAHFFMAGALGAKTGKIDIFPEFLDDNKKVKLGSVQVGHMNPLQGFLVGVAPFIFGVSLLILLIAPIKSYFDQQNYLLLGLFVYLFFTIGNSIFPSVHDLIFTLPFLLICAVIASGIWLSGVTFSLNADSPIYTFLNTLGRVLLLINFINLSIILLLLLLYLILKNAHHRHR